MESPSGGPLLEVGFRTHQGMVGLENQDYLLVRASDGVRSWSVLAIADGMGGLPNAREAAEATIQAVDALVDSTTQMSDAREWLTKVVGRADDAVRQVSRRIGHRCGSTLVVCAVIGERLWVANVGDSRAYLIGSDRTRQITEDHSVVAEAIRRGVLQASRAGARLNQLTRSLGAPQAVVPDLYGPIRLDSAQRLLLCSDGLYAMLDDAQIAEVGQRNTPSESAFELVNRANIEGGYDNVSVIVAQLVRDRG